VKKKTIILGAGLCGLTAAYTLRKANIDFEVFEKDSTVGGNAKTCNHNGYFFDLTGHALHLENDQVKQFLFNELGLKDQFALVFRNSSIFIDNKFIPYPFQYNLKGLQKEKRNDAIIDFLEKRYSEITAPVNDYPSFFDYCESTLGATINSLFMKPYNEKLWAIPTSEIGVDWMGKFVPVPDVEKVLRGAFSAKNTSLEGYNANFFYPKEGGIGVIANKLSEELKGKVFASSEATYVDLSKKRVIINGKKEYSYDNLINTTPLNLFLRLSKKEEELFALNPVYSILDAFIVAIPKNRMPFTWVYLPEKECRSYRIGNFSLFSDNYQKNRDLIYVEVSRTSRKRERPTSFPSVLSDICQVCKTLSEEVELISSFTIEPAYVVYNQQRNRNLERIIDSLWEDYAVVSTGRYGGWKYDSMEGAIFDGMNAVKKIHE